MLIPRKCAFPMDNFTSIQDDFMSKIGQQSIQLAGK